MEAQSFLFGSCSSPPIQNPKKLFLLTRPTSSNIHSSKWVSFKTHKSFDYSHTFVSYKSVKCKINVEQVESDTDFGKDLRKEIRRKNLAVFVSGGGSNFRALHEAILSGSVHGDVVVLVASKHGCGGAEYARHKDIPSVLFPKTKDAPESLSASDLVAALRLTTGHPLHMSKLTKKTWRYNVDFILLAGYLKLIPVELVRAFPKSILNIHPSLLPAFGGKGYYGMKVHKAVIASGARYSGPTIHFVDENYDTGRILAQRVVPVLANDSAEELAARVLVKEHQLYVEVVAALCKEMIIWRNDGVPLIWRKENPNVYS